MDIAKISNIVKSKNVQYDILGNSIAIGDIVAIAYHNTLYYGIVNEVTDRFVRAYDKMRMDNGQNIQIGRGITGKQCIVIQKLMDKEAVSSIMDKKDENEKKLKEAKKAIPKKILVKWFDKRTKQYGFIITTAKTAANKSLQESLIILNEKYPQMMFSILSTEREWLNFDKDIKSQEVKFFNYDKGVFSAGLENPRSINDGFKMLNVPIRIKKRGDDIHFFIYDGHTEQYEGLCQKTYFVSHIFYNYEERPDKTINGIELNMRYIQDYHALSLTGLF